MKSYRLLIPLGLILAFSRAKTFFSDKVKISRVSLSNIRVDFPTLSIRGIVSLSIVNSTGTIIPVSGFHGKITFRGAKVADINSSSVNGIQSGNNIIPINFESSIYSSINVAELLFKEGLSDFVVDANIYSNGLVIPVKSRINII